MSYALPPHARRSQQPKKIIAGDMLASCGISCCMYEASCAPVCGGGNSVSLAEAGKEGGGGEERLLPDGSCAFNQQICNFNKNNQRAVTVKYVTQASAARNRNVYRALRPQKLMVA